MSSVEEIQSELKNSITELIAESKARSEQYIERDHFLIPISFNSYIKLINTIPTKLSLISKTHNETWIEYRNDTGFLLRICSFGQEESKKCKSCLHMNALFASRLKYGTI